MATYRNMHAALTSELDYLLGNGEETGSRGGRTRELLHHTVTLEAPWERFQFHPLRADNPFAKVAETLWVLAGRDDIDWLSYYLPRAPDFSDDGKTWRAAYGPRIRSWRDTSLDQLMNVYRELQGPNHESRRAVINLWDPATDGQSVVSKDYPCNNWLAFLVRNNKLHLSVAVRSNDIMWGWSGINAFEWSVLQEMMACWLGVEVGQLTTFANSWHLYEAHWERAQRIVDDTPAAWPNPYALFNPALAPKSLAWERIGWQIRPGELDAALADFFEIEARLRGNWLLPVITGDPFLQACTRMLHVYIALKGGATERHVTQLLRVIPPSDFRAAAEQYVTRHFAKEQGNEPRRS